MYKTHKTIWSLALILHSNAFLAGHFTSTLMPIKPMATKNMKKNINPPVNSLENKYPIPEIKKARMMKKNPVIVAKLTAPSEVILIPTLSMLSVNSALFFSFVPTFRIFSEKLQNFSYADKFSPLNSLLNLEYSLEKASSSNLGFISCFNFFLYFSRISSTSFLDIS